MSEFHEGRVAATFHVGHKIEDTKEAYEKEIVGLDGMKAGLVMAIKSLDAFNKQIQQDVATARTPVKEADIGLKYVASSIELLQKMVHDTEAKRFAAVGAIEALKRIVTDVRVLWEQEQAKLKEVQEFEAQQPRDIRQRPVGYMPKEKPLDEYKAETDQLEVSQQITESARVAADEVPTPATKPKKVRKT